MVTVRGQVDHKRTLGLLPWIVIETDHCAQMPFALLCRPPCFCVYIMGKSIQLIQINLRFQNRKPQFRCLMVSGFLHQSVQILDHCIQLCFLFSILPGSPAFFLIRPSANQFRLSGTGQKSRSLSRFACILFINRPAVTGLKQFINLVISNLQITASCLGNKRGVRLMQHIVAVLTILHSETEPEFGIAPDIVIHRSAGLLRSKDQMDAQTSSDLSHTDQFFHKVGFLPLQLCELIYNDKQVRNGNLCLMVFIQPGIQVDIVYPVLGKDSLSACILALDGNHGPAHLISGQI